MHRKTRAVLCLMAAVVASGCATHRETVPLERVIDGDTIVVRWGGMEERVRLLDIDAPERGKPGAAEATAALKALVGQGPVRLDFRGDPRRGRYGRLLADVYAGDVNVGAELLRRGLVEAYP